MSQREQVGISLSPKEKQIAQKIADQLGRPLASVLRDCALDGLNREVERIQRLEEFLKDNK